MTIPTDARPQPLTIPTDARPQRLLDAEATVDAAAARFDAGWRRIDEMQAAREALTGRIATETDDKRVEKLRRERRELAAELEQAPHDVLALAEAYAAQLVTWATDAHSWAQREIRAATEERTEPSRAAARARGVVDPSRPAGARDPHAEAAAQAELNALAGPLAALNRRTTAAQSYADAARYRMARHFGDTANGALASPDAVPRWLAGVRRRAQDRAGTNH